MSEVTNTVIDRADLFFTEGSSDKEYHAQLIERDGGYVVDFQYGRRGAALQSGTKTASPVDLAKARKVFDKLVAEKMAKGYTPDQSGEVFQATPQGDRFTGIVPQLLNPISAQEADQYLDDADWFRQVKFDGERRLLKVDAAGVVTGINRKGLAVALPQAVEAEAQRLSRTVGPIVLDGEIIGNKLWVFDALEIGEDVRDLGALDRYLMVSGVGQLIVPSPHAPIEIAQAAWGAQAKRMMFDSLRDACLEGAVFKRSDAPYAPGRPASGGTQLKLKFWESATLEVQAVNADRRSVAVQGWDGQTSVALGNVTIPPNKAVPMVGEIVEVKYLYAHRGGAIYQPEYLGPRGDMAREDCSVSQLKYKTSMDDQPPAPSPAARRPRP